MKSYTLTIVILRPPTIVIEEYDDNKFMESDVVTNLAKCVAANGKPPGASVQWGNREEDVDESLLSIAPSREYNGIPITCTVTHEALTQPLTKTFTPKIEYAPGEPQIVTINPDCDANVNTILQLQCIDNERYPANPMYVKI